MAKIKINRLEFSFLHQSILEKCYSKEELNTTIPLLRDYKLYGYDLDKRDKEAWNNSLKGKFNAVGLNLSGRALYNAAKDFREQKPSIEVSENLLTACLNFLGYKNMKHLRQVMAENIDRQIQSEESLKYRPKSKKKIQAELSKFDNLFIDSLENTTWFLYHHDYKYLPNETPRILRLIIKIETKTSNDNYSIKLLNESPYTSFSGKIIKTLTNPNILVAELDSIGRKNKKRMHLLLNVPPDQAERKIILGGILRHTDAGDIKMVRAVLEKKENHQIENIKNRELHFYNDDKISQEIRDFLKPKEGNILEIPRSVFSHEDLRLHNTRVLTKFDFDLCVVSPFNFSDKHKIKQLDGQIQKMVSDLASEQIGFNRICNLSKKVTGYNEFTFLHAGETLEQCLYFIKKSKNFLFILTNEVDANISMLFGMVLMNTKNSRVWIAYQDNLPFLMQKSDTLKNHSIFQVKLSAIGGINKIPQWLKVNNFTA